MSQLARKRTVSPSRALFRLVTVWMVGLVCLLTQFSTAFHSLLVEHVRCAQHGEWVHADSEHAPPQASRGLETLADRPGLIPSGSEDDHGHEHCTIGSDHKIAVPRPLILESGAPGGLVEPALCAAGSPFGLERIYSFAPKMSPPV